VRPGRGEDEIVDAGIGAATRVVVERRDGTVGILQHEQRSGVPLGAVAVMVTTEPASAVNV
jgi:hypothetical protein